MYCRNGNLRGMPMHRPQKSRSSIPVCSQRLSKVFIHWFVHYSTAHCNAVPVWAQSVLTVGQTIALGSKALMWCHTTCLLFCVVTKIPNLSLFCRNYVCSHAYSWAALLLIHENCYTFMWFNLYYLINWVTFWLIMIFFMRSGHKYRDRELEFNSKKCILTCYCISVPVYRSCYWFSSSHLASKSVFL